MTKFSTVLFAVLVAGWALVGSTLSANAHYRHGSGCCGGPLPPTYIYHTTHAVRHVTRYHDVSRTRYVYRTHRIVHVTRVRPVVYISTVTRIHHHTVGLVRHVYQHMTEYLPTQHIMTNRVINTYDCVCTYHCR